ncbi:MAG: hypothetical protein ACTH0V_00135 [Microbacteriaceae bacterium]
MAKRKQKYLPPRPAYRPGVRTIGIDPSLTSTGIAMFTDDEGWTVGHFDTEPTGPALADTLHRLGRIRGWVNDFVSGFRAGDIVVIEGYMMTQSAMRGVIIANWYKLAELPVAAGVEPVVVAPATRAKYATGGGAGGKDRVMSQVFKRFPEAGVETNDEADAVFLTAIGRHLAGAPIEPAPLPQTHLTVDNHFQPLSR